MPLDQTGAPAPRSLDQWIEYLKRRKSAAKKARAAVKRQRAITEQRLCKAEQALSDIISGADVIAEIAINDDNRPRQLFGVCLLVTLEQWQFEQLCGLGAELEDLEDSHDAEPGHEAEHYLGWSQQASQSYLHATDEGEPSLGSTGMINQRRWSEGSRDDRELDRADDEPSTGADALELDPCCLGEPKEYQRIHDDAIIEEARCRYAAATGGAA